VSAKSQARVTVTAGLRRRPVLEEPPSLPEIPRLIRLLALAHRWDRMLNEGTVASQAEIARRTGLSKARISQIVALSSWAPCWQEDALGARPGVFLSEGAFRSSTSRTLWSDQRASSSCRPRIDASSRRT
jgi:hypothetical protein